MALWKDGWKMNGYMIFCFYVYCSMQLKSQIKEALMLEWFVYSKVDRKFLEVSGNGLVVVISWLFLGGTEMNYKKL
jgi:hypothetical protein